MGRPVQVDPMDGSDHMDGADTWKDRPMDGANPMQPEDPMHGSNPMSGSRCYARISVDEVERIAELTRRGRRRTARRWSARAGGCRVYAG